MASPFFPLLLFLSLVGGAASDGLPPQPPSPRCWPEPPIDPVPVYPRDVDNLQFALNIEFMETEFFLYGALGVGLDHFAPQLAHGGPPPVGVMKANLDPLTRRIIEEFGYQEIGHVRAIQTTVGAIPRPLIDLSKENFAKIFNEAVGYPLEPPFDPYANTLNYLLACYVIPYMGLVGYVGASPNTNGFVSKRVLAGLLAVEAEQDGIVRALLYQCQDDIVHPYNITVADLTVRISMLRNRLAGCGVKDEGLVVPIWLGAENRTCSNIVSADANSLGYPRLPAEILRVLYGTGDEHCPGGFYPRGANGRVARQFLQSHH